MQYSQPCTFVHPVFCIKYLPFFPAMFVNHNNKQQFFFFLNESCLIHLPSFLLRGLLFCGSKHGAVFQWPGQTVVGEKTSQERRLLLTEKRGRECECELLRLRVSSEPGRDGANLPLLLLLRKVILLQEPHQYQVSSKCSHSGSLESPLQSHFMILICLFTSSFSLFDLVQWFQMMLLELNCSK